MNFGKLGLILLSLLIAVVIVVARNQARKDRSEWNEEVSSQSQATPTPIASASALPSSSRSLSPGGTRDFLSRFGESLEVIFGPSGNAVSIRGKPGQGTSASQDFKPSESDSVSSRAQEIMIAARSIIGVQTGSPLGPPRLKTGEVSAQAFFKQNFEGAEVAPYGNVTLDLGAKGEVLAIDSDYLPSLKSENSRTLSADEARPENASGGLPIFWVSNPNSGSGPVTGRHAYEFFDEGRQIIRDASTGETIFERDRRKH